MAEKERASEAVELTETQALQAIKDKESTFKALYARQDIDADLVKRKAYTLVDENNKKIPNCDHVTLPKAANFVNRANAITASANQQIIVEGVDDARGNNLEAFYTEGFRSGDELLMQRNEAIAFTFHSHMINTRGRIGQRIIVEIDEETGLLKVEIIPWDFRFATYEFDKFGLVWASRYTTQSKTAIDAAYGQGKVKGKTGVVRDFWSRTANYVYVDEKLVLSESNDTGEVPVAMALSPAGLHFQDKDMEANRGESILWLSRNLYGEANKYISILTTLNTGALFPPLQKPYEEIPNQQPKAPQGGSRTVVPYRSSDGPYAAMPREDILQATRMGWSIIDSQIQQTSFSTSQMGTLQFPLSSLALEELNEGQELVLANSIQALSLMYLQSSRIMGRQFAKLDKSITLNGKDGKEVKFSKADIEETHDISFTYFTNSRKYILAGISESRDIGGLVDDDYKRRHLLKLENPEAVGAAVKAQEANDMHPELKVYEQIASFVKKEKWAEAWMARLKLRKILMAEYAPQEATAEKQSQPQEGVPLFAGAPSRVGGRQNQDITAEETAKAAKEVEVE